MGDNREGLRLGTYVDRTLEGYGRYKAFLPPHLPPDPPLELGQLFNGIDQATQALARLDGLVRTLPDIGLFLFLYVRKEALLSSQIEGTQSSLSELLLFENDELSGLPLDDVQEVSNYVAAMHYGMNRVREGLPLGSRLWKETHEVLLSKGRGSDKGPGQFRHKQNWIGGSSPSNATFVPPPPEYVNDLMSNLEHFINDENIQLPILVRAALAHVQFETIHPFRDGNGRLGRLVITLLLCQKGALTEPLLYLSLYLKTYRSEYYERLMRVRTNGEWEQWTDFFLQGVTETAQQASSAATEILALFDQDEKKIEGLGRAASSALRVHDYLQRRLILIVPHAAQALSLSGPTIRKSLQHLEDLGIVQETSGKQRGRTYIYRDYLRILQQGTEPIQR